MNATAVNPDTTTTAPGMTAEQAAKRVKRTVFYTDEREDKDGKTVKVEKSRKEAVKADEVLAHRDYGAHVVVVTKDGQKLTDLAE